MNRRCIAILGGSFDPVHNGHIALARHFVELIALDELRIIPAGNPWQKENLHAAPADRIAMLELAFKDFTIPVVIDSREIERKAPTYSIDTLQALRAEVGADVSVAFLIGADQLRSLNTWKHWKRLFDHANFCAASRPGFGIDLSVLAPDIAQEIADRQSPPVQIRQKTHGSICVMEDLDIDVSSTQVRNALRRHEPLNAWLPPAVLDYIKQHHLYET